MLHTLCTDWKNVVLFNTDNCSNKMIYSYIVYVQNINDNNKSKFYHILLTVLHSYPKIIYLYKTKRNNKLVTS